MNKRYTLIMLLVAVALGIFAWMQRDVEPRDFTDGGPTPTPAPLYEMAAEDLQELQVESPDGDYTAVRVAGGWEIDETALSDFAGTTIENLANPSVLRYLPEDRDPGEYGFDSPTMTVTLSTAAGDSQVITVGDENPVDPQYYIRLGEDPRIAIVSSADWSSLLDWVSDPPYAPTATPEASATPEGDAEDAGEDGDAEAEDGDAASDEAGSEDEEGDDAADSEDEAGEDDPSGEEDAEEDDGADEDATPEATEPPDDAPGTDEPEDEG